MDQIEIVTAVQQAVDRAGGKPYTIERRFRLPEDSIRNILKGVEPGTFRMANICAALGLEFYIGPPREALAPLAVEEDSARAQLQKRLHDDPTPVRSAQEYGIASPVVDREIAAVIAVLADEYEELDTVRRAGLLTRFRSFFPDLREKERSLARIVAWLGWRDVEGRTSGGARVRGER